MTHWRAVSAGLLVAVTMEAIIFAISGRFSLIGGLVGSGVAGYIASDEPTDGAWHGLLAALSWGTVLMPIVVLVTLSQLTTVPFPFEYVIGLFESPGDVTTAILLLVTLPNVLAGGVGSLIRGGTGPPTWVPEDWA